MLGWAIFFFIIAIIAALLGFSGVAVLSAEIAQFLFILFLVLFAVAIVVHVIRGGPPR